MASDSSSVLELNDADTTDTDAPSVTDDGLEGAPLIMERGYDIAVKVDAPMKQLSTLETFVTYRVRCVCARWAAPPQVRRRYNHFKSLHKRLAAAHPLLAPPPLPPLHSARQQLDRYSPAFVAVRALALHAFLDRVAKHPILTHSEDFRLFLTTPDEELDKVFKSEYSALNLWGLSSALSGGGDPKPVHGARVRDPEFSSAAEYLASLQHKLAALCALTSRLYKGSVALGGELVGMRRACSAWAGGADGRAGRAAGAAGAGAAAAGAARARAPLRHRATLPLLAAYAAAHADKIRARDAIHASFVSGHNTTDDLHNRLEQASEALRSELSDWTPKTHAEIKSILLEIADRQVHIHTQTLMGWENALKISTEDVSQMFKTVSKSAIQNHSPPKCKADITPNETERDLDDFDIDIEDDTDVARIHSSIHDRIQNSDDRIQEFNTDRIHESISSENEQNSNMSDRLHGSNMSDSIQNSNITTVSIHTSNIKSDSIQSSNNLSDSIQNANITKCDRINESNTQDVQNDSGIPDLDTQDVLENAVGLKNGEIMNSPKGVSRSESAGFSDPLQEFSDVELS